MYSCIFRYLAQLLEDDNKPWLRKQVIILALPPKMTGPRYKRAIAVIEKLQICRQCDDHVISSLFIGLCAVLIYK